MTIEAVLAVLRRWFPGQAVSIQRATAGVSTPVFVVRVDGEVMYARLAEDPGEWRDAEVLVHRRLGAAGVPVPSILRYEAEPPELDRSIALTSRVPGTPLANVRAGEWLLDAGRLAGAALARINEIPVRGYGWVVDVAGDGALVAEHPDRPAWAEEYVRAAHVVAASHLLDRSTGRSLVMAVGCWAALPRQSESRLAHGDVDTTHVHVHPDDRAFTGFIDFGEIRGADRLYDLGHLLLHDGEGGRPAILPAVVRGYTATSPLPNDLMNALRQQAIAIATRALAIQLERSPSPYRDWLTRRLGELVAEGTTADAGGCPEPA